MCKRAPAAVQAHSSVRKACMVSVTPHVRVLPTREDNAFSMEPALLEAAIKDDLAAGARTCCQTVAALPCCYIPACLQSAPFLPCVTLQMAGDLCPSMTVSQARFNLVQ